MNQPVKTTGGNAHFKTSKEGGLVCLRIVTLNGPIDQVTCTYL